MNIIDRVNDLIFICERMSEILTIENKALRAHEGSKLQERLDEKTKLSLFYERHMKSIKKNPELFQQVDEETRKTLRTLSEEMQTLLDENGTLLKIAMDSNRRFLARVAQAAQTHTPHSGTYSQDAKAGPQGAFSTIPVSLNQEL